jgi:hypothetical protein
MRGTVSYVNKWCKNLGLREKSEVSNLERRQSQRSHLNELRIERAAAPASRMEANHTIVPLDQASEDGFLQSSANRCWRSE